MPSSARTSSTQALHTFLSQLVGRCSYRPSLVTQWVIPARAILHNQTNWQQGQRKFGQLNRKRYWPASNQSRRRLPRQRARLVVARAQLTIRAIVQMQMVSNCPSTIRIPAIHLTRGSSLTLGRKQGLQWPRYQLRRRRNRLRLTDGAHTHRRA